MSEERELVFVYGTLRRGGSNHFRMEGAEFVAKAWVPGRLYRIDWYPGIVLEDRVGDVLGELYEVSDEQLSELDEFEGAEFRRIKADAVLPTGKGVGAWLWEYPGKVDEECRIASGDWILPPIARSHLEARPLAPAYLATVRR